MVLEPVIHKDLFFSFPLSTFCLFRLFLLFLPIMEKGKAIVVSPDSSTTFVVDLINNSFITSSKLFGKNYIPWSAAIQTFLTSKEKLKYIEAHKHDDASPTWAKEDAQLRSWLWNRAWSVMWFVMSCHYLLPMLSELLSKKPMSIKVIFSASMSFARIFFSPNKVPSLFKNIIVLWKASGRNSTCTNHFLPTLSPGRSKRKRLRWYPF